MADRMDENDPIWMAIDRGGGQTCDVAGVLEELAKAGYLIRKAATADKTPQDIALDAVQAIVAFHGANNGETVDRAVVRMLGVMWANAVRAEWMAFVDADPELKAQHAVALELMKDEGYTMDTDPVCMLPGMKPMVAVVDGKESVCVDYCLSQVTPLSAIYVNRVRLVQSAAARVAKRLAEEAAKDPNQEWPIKTAAGEVFNSIEEMKASPNEFIRGLAESMEKAGEARAADIHAWHDQPAVPLSCWQFFGFDGPVSLHKLQLGYLGRVECESTPSVANAKLAAEAHRQYQNCLRELGAAIMDGPAEGNDDAATS